MKVLEKLTARLAQHPQQMRAQEVRGFCSEVKGVSQIAECRPRTTARVVGIVKGIEYSPTASGSVLRIRIYDGTDELVGAWFGRKEIPGADLGKPMVLEGTVRPSPTSKTLEMMNPAYELVPE